MGEGVNIGREVHCACVTDDDRITVYRIGGLQPISENLDQETDFTDALWLFESGTREQAQLVVQFHSVDGQLVADLYQDQDGDGRVTVEIVDGDARITEVGSWSIRTVALDGYWQRDGRIADNFDIYVDDRFIAAFGGELYQDAMANDGVIDVVIRVRGPHPDDPRSYDWRNVYSPVSESSGILRTVLMVRESGMEPSFPPVFPWYLIGDVTGLIKNYGVSTPPIQIEWETGRLAFLGEFVASRGSDVNWFDYSLIRVEPDSLTNPNFESPFAFYDLAADQDSIPELMVRVQRTVPDDPYDSAAAAWRGRSYQQVRYVWDQDNTQNWSYKLGLMGQQTIDGAVAFPDFTLKSIPYEVFPGWVTSHSWDIASFVAAEEPLWTTEGIYDGDFGRSLRDGYYAGVSAEVGGFGSAVRAGLRMDTAVKFQRQPWLYFSPIDRQLHLESAESGVWNIDDRRIVRYLNDSSGPSFDGWQLWDNDQLTAQLYRVPGGLLYSDATGTFVVDAEIPEQIFRSLPPTTHEEWLALGQHLETNKVAFEQGDLRAMFDQFDGAVQITSHPLSGFTRTADGFSFTVTVDDSETGDALSSLTGAPVTDGMQVVRRAGTRWTATSAEFVASVIAISVDPIDSLSSVPVQVTITNPGSIELRDATLTIQAITESGQTGTVLGQEELSIAGGGEQRISFPWAPGRSGAWQIQATITRNVINARTGDQITLVQTTQPIQVAQPSVLPPKAAGTLGWPGSFVTRIALILSLLLVTALAAGAALWRGLRLR